MMLSSAVRARSVLATSSHIELGVLGNREVLAAHLVDPTGGVLIRPGAHDCWARLLAGEPCPTLDLVASDVTAVPQPDRVRAVVRMRGRIELLTAPQHCQLQSRLGLERGDAMGRYVPDSIVLTIPTATGHRSVAVPVEEYAEAVTDPLAGWEATWLRHLDSAHAPMLRELVRQRERLADSGLTDSDLTDSDTVRAFHADSAGLTLRIYRDGSPRDVRFDFPTPVRCGRQAIAALNALISAHLPACADREPGSADRDAR